MEHNKGVEKVSHAVEESGVCPVASKECSFLRGKGTTHDGIPLGIPAFGNGAIVESPTKIGTLAPGESETDKPSEEVDTARPLVDELVVPGPDCRRCVCPAATHPQVSES